MIEFLNQYSKVNYSILINLKKNYKYELFKEECRQRLFYWSLSNLALTLNNKVEIQVEANISL